MYKEGELLTSARGSTPYALPEIIKGLPYQGTHADLWSCSVVLFVMVTGRPPFKDKDPEKFKNKIVKCDYSFLNAKVSDNLKDLIGKMLITDPSKRLSIQEI
jgi:serine/threonine-protein kinase HSL1 (negative regulator of Swe1 kinase)